MGGEFKTVGVIALHFDVPAHALSLSTFIETAAQTRVILDTFNKQLYDERLLYELYVLPPEEGTFLNKLGLSIVAGFGIIWAFVESDNGKAFVRGLTDHEPAHYFEEAGKYIKKQMIDQPPPFVLPPETAPESIQDGSTAIIVQTIKSFMQKDIYDLRKVGIDDVKFRDAFEARNKFYLSCNDNRQIRTLGFEQTERFPIKRPDFLRLQVPVFPARGEDLIESLDSWTVEIVSLLVTSPNWDREDRQRAWKGKDINGKERTFIIQDENFWILVGQREIQPGILDTIKVQWAFQVDRRRTPRVLKVLEYNQTSFGQPLDQNALTSILGHFVRGSSDQNSLFPRDTFSSTEDDGNNSENRIPDNL